ncbi:MAG: ATP-binding cassette domain-containing protein [Paludibacter sp.]|jgi:phospholipid/cholesterol/gamma-HCH transport system ATP-binding protein|nr:ATP-binding cassette domain-containing protein [Paludibacter sp.]
MKTEQTELPVEDTVQIDPNDPIIEITKLCKSFGTQQVLKDLSLKLYNGENLVVLGKSGSGKSVLIKCIVGLLRSDSGTIQVFNHDVTALTVKELGKVRQEIGFLFQSGALYDSMTVKQNLEFPLIRLKTELSEKDRNVKIEEVLENVGLSDALYKMPSQLSGGMRKRISLARTIVVDPKIILYDEPTTGLDPVTSDEISVLINDIQKKYKTSSIIITHDIECARATADRLIMLQNGQIYADGDIDGYENSKDKVIKAFFK